MGSLTRSVLFLATLANYEPCYVNSIFMAQRGSWQERLCMCLQGNRM